MLKTLIRLNIGFFTLLSFVTAGFESHGISLNVLTNDTDIVNNNSIDNLTLPVHAKIHVIESTKRTHVSSTKSNGVELIRNDRSESSHRQNSESDLDEQFKESSKNFIIKIDNETIENLLETSTAHTTEKKAFDIGNLFSAKKAADDIEESTDIQLKSLHSPPDLSKASLNDFATPGKFGNQLNSPLISQKSFSASRASYNPRNINKLLTKRLYIGKLFF